MGETYRGLTIRFGGDTTSLQKALKSANAGISATQSELRKLNQALKFDPSDVVALNVKMDLLKEKSQYTYERIATLNEKLKQIDSTDITKLAASFERTGKALSESKAHYDALDYALAQIKDKINKIAGEKGLDVVFSGANRREVAGMVEEFASLGGECNVLVTRFRDLQEQWSEASYELDTNREQAQLQDLAVEFVKVTSEARQLRQEFIALSGKSIFNEPEAIRYNEKLKDIDSTLEMVEDESKRLKNTLQLDPESLAVAGQYVKSLNDEFSLVEEKTSYIRTRIASIKKELGNSNEATKAINSTAREARVEFIRWADALAESNAKIGQAESHLSSLNQQADKLIKEGRENTQQFKNLEQRILSAKERLVDMRQEQEKVQEKFNMAQAITELKQLEVQEKECATRAKVLRETLDTLGDSVRINASTFTTLGMALSQNITPNIMMAASYSVEAAKEIDAAYRDMRKTVNGTEEDFENLKQAAMDFASTNVTSADQILEIQAMGGQMGLLVDELETFATVIANLNVATNIEDASEMAEIMGQLTNILSDLTSETMPSFGDALVRLGNNNAALESDILDVTSRIGSMGSICEFTTPQLLAWATAIAATGQGSEAAGTAISKTMSDIEGAVGEGGAALEAFAEVAGMTADEFANKWNNAPSEALQKFIQGLKRIDTEGGSVDNTLEELGITAVRQKQALEGLTQTVDTLDNALTMSQDAWDGVSDEWGDAGDAANEAQKKAEGFSGQLSILQNNAQMLGASFAESLAPILQIVNSLLQELYLLTKDMPDSLKLVIMAVTGLVAAAGPLATIIGPISTAFKTINSNSAKMKDSMAQAAGGMSKAEKGAKALSVAMTSLKVVIALIIVEKLISYFAEMYESQKKLTNATTGLANALSDEENSFKKTGSAATSSGKSISDYTTKISKLSSSTDEAISRQSDLADSIKDTWTGTIADISLAKKYQETMETLAGNVGGDITKFNELKLAVAGYNEITGSSIEVTDENTGTLSLNSSQIAANTEAWEKNAKIQALQEVVRETYKEQIQTQARINELLQTRNRLEEQFTYGMTDDEFKAWSKQYSEVNSELNKNLKLLEGSSSAIDNYAEAMDDLSDGVDSFSNSLTKALVRVNMSENDFKEWAKSIGASSEEAMQTLVENINNGSTASQAAILFLTGMTIAEFNAAAESVGVSGTLMCQNYELAIQDGVEPIVAAAMSVTGLTISQFEFAASRAGYSGEDAVVRFAQAIASGDYQAKEAARVVGEQAKVGLETGSAGSSTVGENFVSGFLGKIFGAHNQAYLDAYELGQSAYAGLMGGVDAHSPSKLAQKVGINFAKLGFIDTIAQYENESYEAAKRLGQSSVSGINAGILAMRDAAQASVEQTLARGTVSSVSNTTNNNSSTTNIVMNVTADNTTTLDSLIAQAKRAQIAYRR